MRLLYTSTLAAAVALSGCAQGPGTILNTGITFDEAKTITGVSTGARQRIVTGHQPGVLSPKGQVQPLRVLCVEPSPDVALAVANSFGVGLSVLGQGSGAVSGSTAEGVAQLAERTVAIQALLKQGYQACLDYANGAITRTTYSLRTAKLDDLLVTLVLGEVAGGAFGRSGAAIGGKSNGAAEASLAGLAATRTTLEETRKQIGESEKQLAKLETDLAAEKAKLAATPPPSDDDAKTINANVASFEAQIKAENAVKTALVESLKSSSRATAQSAAEISNVSGIGGLTSRPNPEVAKVISEMQARFLEKNTDHAIVSACMTEMADRHTKANKIPGDVSTRAFDRVASGIENGKATAEDYYALGAVLDNTAPLTYLTSFCDKHLNEILRQSIANRQALDMKRLDVEAARIAAVANQAPAPTRVSPIHPSSALTKLDIETARFAKAKTTVESSATAGLLAKIPAAEKKPLQERRTRWTSAAGDLQTDISAATTTDARKTIKTLEQAYTTLVEAPEQHGSAGERAVWAARLKAQQQEAKLAQARLTALSDNARTRVVEAQSLISDIKAAVPNK